MLNDDTKIHEVFHIKKKKKEEIYLGEQCEIQTQFDIFPNGYPIVSNLF